MIVKRFALDLFLKKEKLKNLNPKVNLKGNEILLATQKKKEWTLKNMMNLISLDY